MIKLKPYQEDAVHAIKETFEKNNKQYIEMPTGSGKTITFLHYAKNSASKILIIVPSRQLQQQVFLSCLNFYDRKDISRKGNNHDEKIKKVHICIVASIKTDCLEDLVKENFDLIIIDEAHHVYSKQYKRFIDFKCERYPDQKILGVTATPDRSDGMLLSDILDKCSFKLEISHMIEDGYLCDIEGFSVKTNIDISDVRAQNGDFSICQLYKKLSTDSRNDMIVNLYKNELIDRRCIIFCINIQHSKEINKLLNYNGISSAHIDGYMDLNKKNQILKSFREGEISCICNCQLLTEGFDEPCIDGIILSRPTQSKTLFMQMIGRGLRVFPGKLNCKIIDIVDNHKCLKSFTSIASEFVCNPIERFRSIKDIQEHVRNEIILTSEIKLEKVNFFFNFDINSINENEATESMIDYLKLKNIYFQHPITVDEATFLIWYNELKLKVKNGNYK
jgi:superfamily II DNA or RNA helicase